MGILPFFGFKFAFDGCNRLTRFNGAGTGDRPINAGFCDLFGGLAVRHKAPLKHQRIITLVSMKYTIKYQVPGFDKNLTWLLGY